MRKLPWAITLLTLTATVIAIQFLPDSIPVRYGADGEIASWGSRYVCLIFPFEIMLIVGFFEFIAFSFERAAGNRERRHLKVRTPESALNNAKVIRRMTPWIAGSLSVVNFFLLIKQCKDAHAGVSNLELDTMKLMTFIYGILFVVIGNLMPKTRRNGVVGFRTRHTLYNDTTWQKSNRFAGVGLMIVGACSVISSCLVGGIASVLLMLAYMTVLIVMICVYAKRIYDEEKAKETQTE